MRYYLDCEFDGHSGPLLSIALVSELGDSIYIKTKAQARDPWVIANVLPVMDRHNAKLSVNVDQAEVGGVLEAFIGKRSNVIIVADSAVDIARFCQVLTTKPNGQWRSLDYPRMTFEVHNIKSYPTNLRGAVQHNAYWDAAALRHRFNFG